MDVFSEIYKIKGIGPHERTRLPHLKDPSQKMPFWKILKDLIGKDLTKVSMPVYFNEPISIT